MPALALQQRARVIRAGGQHLLEAGAGLVGAPERVEGRSEVGLSVGVARLVAEHRRVRRDGLVEPAGLSQRVPDGSRLASSRPR